ncbi:hypothetical protein WN944_017031 [Citrus x changshan-huyou]|uniref:Uncharacterized protein n=1 Tax=Citrus x changshan-huyou TaxID=2935761 RepID=A0AAP0MD31_9ROSI
MGKKKKHEKLKLVVAELIRRREQTRSYSDKADCSAESVEETEEKDREESGEETPKPNSEKIWATADGPHVSHVQCNMIKDEPNKE